MGLFEKSWKMAWRQIEALPHTTAPRLPYGSAPETVDKVMHSAGLRVHELESIACREHTSLGQMATPGLGSVPRVYRMPQWIASALSQSNALFEAQKRRLCADTTAECAIGNCKMRCTWHMPG